MQDPNWHNMTDDQRATFVLQQVYRKHMRTDPEIGWEELGTLVANELMHRMGDLEFKRFIGDLV